jgi:hypothetical protein
LVGEDGVSIATHSHCLERAIDYGCSRLLIARDREGFEKPDFFGTRHLGNNTVTAGHEI